MKSKYSEHYEIKDVITNKEYATGNIKSKSTGVDIYVFIYSLAPCRYTASYLLGEATKSATPPPWNMKCLFGASIQQIYCNTSCTQRPQHRSRYIGRARQSLDGDRTIRSTLYLQLFLFTRSTNWLSNTFGFDGHGMEVVSLDSSFHTIEVRSKRISRMNKIVVVRDRFETKVEMWNPKYKSPQSPVHYGNVWWQTRIFNKGTMDSAF